MPRRRLYFASLWVMVASSGGFVRCAGALPVSQRLDGQVQIGFIQDSNVKESLENEVSDQALRILGSLEHQLQLTRRLRMTSVCWMGLSRYRKVEDDGRVMGEAQLQFLYSGPKRVAAGARLNLEGRDYADSAATRGYGLLAAEPFLRFPIGSLLGEITAARTILDYRVTPGREQDGYRVELALRKRFYQNLVVGVQGGGGAFDFNRRAVNVSTGRQVVLREDQHDTFWLAGAEVQYLRGVYLALGYTLLRNDSNTFGLDYVSHRFDLTFGDRLSRTLSLRLLARLEVRDYEDVFRKFKVVNFDSEREDNDAVIVEIGRALDTDLTLKLRAGLHHNESVFRGERYTKFLGETHLEWRF